MLEHISNFLRRSENSQTREEEEIRHIRVDEIIANPFQPRNVFDDEKIDELAQSIELHGMIQPIVVRQVAGKYEIVAGERRWRAATKLSRETVPAIIRQMSDEETATIALIENLQREGLTAIEEANAFQQLLLLQSITQEELAMQLGKSQSAIANKLRLLQLSDPVKEALSERKITERHARSLLRLNDSNAEQRLLHEIIARDLSVKQLDTKIKYLIEEQNINKHRRISYAKDVRLALNTVRQAIEMVQNSGLPIQSEEYDHETHIEIKIRLFKQK